MMRHHKLLAFCIFSMITICYFGTGIINHLTTAFAGNAHTDKYIYIWNLAWWPYALSHHLNPFFPTIVSAPTGINLAKVTSLPGLALIGAPFTALFGPITTYNVMMLLSPTLAAWTAYLLGFYLLKNWRYALVTGYFYGYSCYMIAHMMGHLNLVAPAFLIPLIPLLVLKRINHEISRTSSILFLTIILTSIFLISSEIFITVSAMGSVIAVLAYIIFPEKRSDLRSYCSIVVAAYCCTALLSFPYIYYFFTDQLMGKIGAGVTAATNDFLNLFIPDALFLLSNDASKQVSSLFTCNIFEWNTYLGIGLIIILIIFSKQFWTTKSGKFLILSSVLLTVASFGPSLHVAGQKIIGFPWRFLFMLPIIHLIAPARIALFASLSIAISVGWWTQKSPSNKAVRISLLLIAILFTMPTFNQHDRQTALSTVPTPAFFSAGLYKQYLTPTDIVIMFPYFDKGPQLLWQTQSDFSFRMADGYLGDMPLVFQQDPVIKYLLKDTPANQLTKQLLIGFAERHHITKMIITNPSHQAWSTLLGQIDAHPVQVGGVMIYTLTSHKNATITN